MRVIWDTRMAPWSSAPSAVPFASTEALTPLECERGDEIHLRSADLEVAFYQFSLPEALRPWFCLPPIRGRHLSDEAARHFRTGLGKLLFIAAERCDVQFEKIWQA